MSTLLRLAHVACLAPVALVACGAGVEPRAPRGVAPPSAVAASDSPELPDASHLRALSAKIDGSCSDLCCVPKPEWLREHGEPPSAAVVRAAWNALEGSPRPADATVALRIVSRSASAADVPRLVAFVDDERPGVSLPSERPQQAPTPCVPISWTPATPSSEARRALGRVFGTSFATAKDYRAWALAHPDPERSFEVWSARLSRQEPPPAELVDALRATDLDLYVRVMLARCHGDGRCGVSPSELTSLVKARVGVARALRWLEGTEPIPERQGGSVGQTYANLLRPAEALYTTAELPTLDRMWERRTFERTVYQAMLGVLLARLRPSDRRTYLRAILEHGGFEFADEGVALGLREAARTDPTGLEAEITSWCFMSESRVQENERVVFEGLAEAEASAAPVLARLLKKRIPPLTGSAAQALHRAGVRFGCKGLGDAQDLTTRAAKGQSASAAAGENERATRRREALVAAMRACLKG